MAKYLVTGGAGFIGSNVVEALVNLGEDVVVIDNLVTGKIENLEPFLSKIKFVKGCITDSVLLEREFRGVDFVIHLAALASVPRSINNPVLSNKFNVEGTLNVFEVSRLKNVKKVVYASSSSVYGNSEILPKSEDMSCNPVSFYALQKRVCEDYAKLYFDLYDTSFIGLRFFNVFGPKQDPYSEYSAVIPLFIKSYQQNKKPMVFGDGLTSRDFTYVSNVVDGILLACKSSVKTDVFNIACNDRVTLNELAKQIQVIMNKDVGINYADERVGDVKHSQASIVKAGKLLGFSPRVSFIDGLKKTIDWLEAEK